MVNFMYIFEILLVEFIKKNSVSKKHTLLPQCSATQSAQKIVNRVFWQKYFAVKDTQGRVTFQIFFIVTHFQKNDRARILSIS